MHQSEGDVWRALGIMAAGGALRNAALLLRELRMPDAAAAFCAACKEAGFHSPFAPTDAGVRMTILSSDGVLDARLHQEHAATDLILMRLLMPASVQKRCCKPALF